MNVTIHNYMVPEEKQRQAMPQWTQDKQDGGDSDEGLKVFCKSSEEFAGERKHLSVLRFQWRRKPSETQK